MAIQATHKDTTFGVGDVVDLYQTIVEPGKDKSRTQVFQGTVIGIKGRDIGRTITLRRIGSQNIGVELIMPLASPLLEKIEVVREGQKGSRRAKLYYIRDKSKREIESIYSRAKRKKANEPVSSHSGGANATIESKSKKKTKKTSKKATTPKES